jgi:hypothetical protein
MLTRVAGVESINIFETARFSLLRSLCPPEAAILEDARFTLIPEEEVSIEGSNLDSYSIIAWEGVALSGRLFVFTGETCRVVSSIQGEVEPVEATGFDRLVCWSPCGRLALLSSGSTGFSLYNALGMRIGLRLDLTDCFGGAETVIYREKPSNGAFEQFENFVSVSKVVGEAFSRGPAAAVSRETTTRMSSSLRAGFCPRGHFLAVNSPDIPNLLFIFRAEDLLAKRFIPHTISSFRQPIRQMAWHDASVLLTVVTAGPESNKYGQLYTWHGEDQDGFVPISVPRGLCDVRSAKWAPGADSLIVCGRGSFCMGVPTWASV